VEDAELEFDMMLQAAGIGPGSPTTNEVPVGTNQSVPPHTKTTIIPELKVVELLRRHEICKASRWSELEHFLQQSELLLPQNFAQLYQSAPYYQRVGHKDRDLIMSLLGSYDKLRMEDAIKEAYQFVYPQKPKRESVDSSLSNDITFIQPAAVQKLLYTALDAYKSKKSREAPGTVPFDVSFKQHYRKVSKIRYTANKEWQIHCSNACQWIHLRITDHKTADLTTLVQHFERSHMQPYHQHELGPFIAKMQTVAKKQKQDQDQESRSATAIIVDLQAGETNSLQTSNHVTSTTGNPTL